MKKRLRKKLGLDGTYKPEAVPVAERFKSEALLMKLYGELETLDPANEVLGMARIENGHMYLTDAFYGYYKGIERNEPPLFREYGRYNLRLAIELIHKRN